MKVDFLIVGGGIAGASIGYWLAARGRTLLVEAESQPGYHATGRSAALYAATYGPPLVRALTRASHDFLHDPPAGFAPHPLMRPRGALIVAQPGQRELLDAEAATLTGESLRVRRLDVDEACALLPALRPQRVLGALHDPEVADLDVHALHQGLLRGLRAAGGQLRCDAAVTAIERSAQGWQALAGAQAVQARVLVNAAGAWVDEVAALAGVAAIGIEPRRRSAFVFSPPPGLAFADWPMVVGIDESWYLKPDAGMLLGSPANADPVVPHDVQPEELDIALAIHRIEEMTTLAIRRPQRAWAGLRSFVADGSPVAGFDATAPGFFWLAGQGGYGIQTAPALGRAAAALACGDALPAELQAHGIDADALSPRRLRTARRPPIA